MWARSSVEALKGCIDDFKSGDDADGHSVVFYSQPALGLPVTEYEYVIGKITNVRIEDDSYLFFEYEGETRYFTHDDNEFLGWRLHTHPDE